MDADNTGPVSIDATGEPPHDGMYDSAVTMDVTYQFKNPDWTLVWAQPGKPSTELQARYGAVYWGDKGSTHGHQRRRRQHRDRAEGEGLRRAMRLRQGVPQSRAQRELRGLHRTREKPIMHMEAGMRVASLCILGNVGFQLQRKLEWDPVNERVMNDDEANRLLSRPGRGPWHL